MTIQIFENLKLKLLETQRWKFGIDEYLFQTLGNFSIIFSSSEGVLWYPQVLIITFLYHIFIIGGCFMISAGPDNNIFALDFRTHKIQIPDSHFHVCRPA